MRQRWQRHGLTIVELLVVIGATAIVLVMALPSLARIQNQSDIDVSVSNLISLGVSHVMYAADWEGRQVTWTRDDFGGYPTLCAYTYDTGEDHPWIWLGWSGGFFWGFPLECSNGYLPLALPYHFPSRYGNFRGPSAKAFHDYVGGRVYDPSFFPPADVVVLSTVEPFFDVPEETVVPPDYSAYEAGYCFSPAAMFDPMVLRAPSQGGWQNPLTTSGSTVSPGLFTAMYPDLKTQMIEHQWLQNRPSKCNPQMKGPYLDGCEPWYFNHGMDSSPVTLFYDLQVRQLPNQEVFDSDQTILKQTGGIDGLWSRDTQPYGANGYHLEYSFDDTPLGHHILTTDGILGRDTLGS